MSWLSRFRPQASWLWPTGIAVLVLVIALQNFAANTWLTGWDTLHPEFNFSRNFSSLFFGAWREDQGLGAPAAHSHMSELPRVVFLWLLSPILPPEVLRYSYIFLCLLIGPLGMYAFVKTWITAGKQVVIRDGSAFISALLYLFNLVTMQQFFVVFEMFAVQFASLGWLFLFTTNYIYKKKNRDLLLLGVVSLLASPMAYASLLWFATIASLLLYAVTLTFLVRVKSASKTLIKVVVVILATNAYWLLPNLYFLLSPASSYPANSHINRLFSEESFVHNQSYGDWLSVIQLKNFLFSWKEFDATSLSFKPLLETWNNHLKLPLVFLLGYILPFFALVGLGKAIFQKISGKTLPPATPLVSLLPVGLLSLFALINMNPPFTSLFSYLREHSALFAEGLRTPFTKFSFQFVFVLASLAGLGVASFLETLKEKKGIFRQKLIAIFVLSLAIVLYCAPFFSGNLVAPKLRKEIPTVYFELFEWFSQQPQATRVAQLPLPSYAGWEYYNWGYEGAGFIWFGLTQPVLVRDFDRWQPANETFYNQLSDAVYNTDVDALARTLKKFDVGYLLLDESIIKPGENQQVLLTPEIKSLLTQVGAHLVWNKDFISVYALQTTTNSFLNTASNATPTFADTTYSARDPIYGTDDYSSSISESNSGDIKQQGVVFPFSDLTKPIVAGIVVNEGIATYKKDVYLSKPALLQIPLPQTGEIIQATALVTYTDQGIVLDFSEKPRVVVGAQTATFFNLETIVLPMPPQLESVYLDINGGQFLIEKNGTSKKKTLALEFGLPLAVKYFDAKEAIAENNQVVIDSTHVSTLQISPSQLWDDSYIPQKIKLDPGDHTVTIHMPTVGVLPNIYDQSHVENCSEKNEGSVEKKLQLQSVEFIAQNSAVACEYFSQLDINPLLTYILHASGSTLTGRAQKLYVKDLTNNRVVLEELLPNHSFDQSYSLFGSKRNTSGWALSLETRSFRHIESRNKLNQLAFYPLPLELLARFSITTDNFEKVGEYSTIEKSEKIGTFLYHADLKIEGEETVLTLSQSHDPAWIAFPSNRPWQLLDHRIYNGWANAWIVSAGTTAVTILFWPQLLSFFGYGVLIATFGWLSITALRQPTKSVTGPTKHSGGYVGSSKTLDYFVIRRFKQLRKKLLGE